MYVNDLVLLKCSGNDVDGVMGDETNAGARDGLIRRVFPQMLHACCLGISDVGKEPMQSPVSTCSVNSERDDSSHGRDAYPQACVPRVACRVPDVTPEVTRRLWGTTGAKLTARE